MRGKRAGDKPWPGSGEGVFGVDGPSAAARMPGMEGLKRLLFEDPLYAYIALGFAELVLAVIWHEKRTSRALSALVVPPLLAGAVWLVATRVVTEREQIIAATEAIARDAEAGSVAAADEFLDEEYRGYAGTRDAVLEIAKAALRAYRIEKVAFTQVEVTVEEDRAAMHIATVITLKEGKVPLAWDVQWAKRPMGWRIVDLSEPQSKLGL